MFLTSKNNNNTMTFMVIVTSLCNKYDEWKNDSNIMSIVDLNTNSICIGLKQMYPSIDDKVVQSIALAFTTYFVILYQDKLQNETENIINNLIVD